MAIKSLKSLFVVAPLLIALALYILYRPMDIGVNRLGLMLFDASFYFSLIQDLKMVYPLSNFMIYSLPGGLWVFSLTVMSQKQIIELGQMHIEISKLPILYALGLEMCQLLSWTDGRFDPFDIVAYLLAWICANIFAMPTERYPRFGLNAHTAFLIFGYMILCLANLY